MKQRSNNQNDYYFGYVIPAVIEAMAKKGNYITKEELHKEIRIYIWEWYEEGTSILGEPTKIPKSSTLLTTEQWEANMTKTRMWFAERGLMLALPNEAPNYFMEGENGD